MHKNLKTNSKNIDFHLQSYHTHTIILNKIGNQTPRNIQPRSAYGR